MPLMKSNPQPIKLFLILGIGLYPSLFIFQGIDFTDFGFWATNYKFIFQHPESIYTTLFPVYFSNVIGGVVHKLFGFLGLVSFRIFYVIELYIISYLAYRLLTVFFNRLNVLIALLISIIYISYYLQGTLNWISYNDLSSLFYLLCAFYLFFGMVLNKNSYLIFSGIFLGLNFFIRLSNFAGLLLASAIVVDSLHNKKSLKECWVSMRHFGAGIFLGISIIVLVMFLLGHHHLYVASISLYKTFGWSLDPSHKCISGFSTYFVDLFQSFITATYFILGCLLILVTSRYSVKLLKIRKYLILFFIGIIISYLLITIDLPILNKIKGLYHIRWIFWQCGVLWFALLYILFLNRRENSQLFLLSFIALVILFVTPLGSNRSLLNSNFGMWLALPLAISVFLEGDELRLFSFSLDRYSSFMFRAVILSTIALYAINANLHETFRDSSNRSELVTRVRHPYFRWLFTTKERASSIDELMAAVKIYTLPKDYVWGHEYVSMFNYLTDCRPYMYGPNPMYFSIEVYGYLYSKARKEIAQLPIIIAAKGRLDVSWPTNASKGLKHPNPSWDKLLNQQREVVSKLRNESNYYKVWENNFFEIWKPVHISR